MQREEQMKSLEIRVQKSHHIGTSPLKTLGINMIGSFGIVHTKSLPEIHNKFCEVHEERLNTFDNNENELKKQTEMGNKIL